jgi:Trypsin-like peptidase domain
VNPLLKVTTACLFFAPSFNHICLYAFPPHDIDVDEKGRWEKTYRNVQQFVGRVFFHKVCQGSFALLVWLKKLYIITCRHVVFDEDMGGIPIFCLFFVIQNMSFSAKEGNLKYVGSTNSELDLSFFEVQNEAVKGFHLDVNHDVYQGQSITIAGFPSGLEELEGELEKEPKVQSGRVAAAGSVNKVAFSDISGSLPNTSGAAMISTMDFGRTLYGIHGGAVNDPSKNPMNTLYTINEYRHLSDDEDEENNEAEDGTPPEDEVVGTVAPARQSARQQQQNNKKADSSGRENSLSAAGSPFLSLSHEYFVLPLTRGNVACH